MTNNDVLISKFPITPTQTNDTGSDDAKQPAASSQSKPDSDSYRLQGVHLEFGLSLSTNIS